MGRPKNPCPNGLVPSHLHAISIEPFFDYGGRKLVVECECGWRGPARDTEDEALNAWNDRRPAPVEGEALEALEARVNYLETADAVHKLNAQNMYEYQLKLEARLATLEQIAGYGSAAAPAGEPGRGERSGEGEG